MSNKPVGTSTTRVRRAAALATTAALLATVFVSGVGPAPEASAVPAPPIADGIYLEGSGWVTPGGFIGLISAGNARCYEPRVFTFNGLPVTLEFDGRGFPDWGVVDYLQLPASLVGVGSLVLTCSTVDNSPAITVSFPLNITATQPASTYREPGMFTFFRPVGSDAVTVNKVGFLAGESVTVTLYDQSLIDAGGFFEDATLPPVTVAADGEGAITTQITVPPAWGLDIEVLSSAATSRRVINTGWYTGGLPTNNPTFTASAASSPGGTVTVSGTGYAPTESVVIALHSSSAPALVLGTVTATGAGAVTGTFTIPTNVTHGTYRVWAGSKTLSYVLQNAPIVIEDPATFADVGPTNPFYTFVQWMASSGISTGTAQPSGKPLYKPADAVSRQAMALFMYRLSGETFVPPVTPTFADVATTSQFYTAVEWMFQRSISTGTAQPSGKPLFKPSDPVSRQAMALFVARYAGANLTTPPTTQRFADVPLNAGTAAAIDWMFTTGISTGTTQPSGLPLYRPTNPVSRQAMAAFLFRVDNLP